MNPSHLVQAPGRWPESSLSNLDNGTHEDANTGSVSSLSALVGASLGAGDGAVMIAAPALCDAIEARLRDQGIDVAAVRARGRYRTYPTADVLAKVGTAGSVDEIRLREILGEIVTRAAAVTYRVFAYSDLAATLDAGGDHAAAAQLTAFWHALPTNFSQPVRCADANTVGATGLEAGPLTQAGGAYAALKMPASTTHATENNVCGQAAIGGTRRSDRPETAEAGDRFVRLFQRVCGSSRTQDDLLAALSHELRTPLNPALLLATEAAGNSNLPAETRANFDVIARNIASEARLIDDLFDFSRMLRGKFALELRPTDVREILRGAIGSVYAEMQDKRIALTAHLGSGGMNMAADAVYLPRVFYSVLSNAVKFTPEGGTITVSLEICDPEARIRITIIDSGIGMTPEEIRRLFVAFSQGDHAQGDCPHRFGGLGLGLAIAHVITELHGGSIRAASAGADCGSTFVIELPLSARGFGDEQTGRVGSVSAPTLINRIHRILLVEDHDSTRTALAHLLRRRGFDVVAARSVAEARRLVATDPVDFVISDVGLPDGNGYELMAELRRSRGLLGLALTGFDRPANRPCDSSSGVVGHLKKPVNIQSLDRVLAGLGAGENEVRAPAR